MELKGPESLRRQHERLQHELRWAIEAGGHAGRQARRLADILRPHLAREEEIALPALGLLSALAEGRLDPEMRGVLPMTERLWAELPRLRREHEDIEEAAGRLEAAARAEGQFDIAELARCLALYVRMEEEVLHPAALLVGEFLKAKIGCAPIRAAAV